MSSCNEVLICRVCLQHSAELLDIFNTSHDENIAQILNQHLWFEPSPNDISTVICLECWRKVNEFHTFYVSVEQAHLQLIEVSHPTPTLKLKVKEEIEDIEQNNPLYEPEVIHTLMNTNEHIVKDDFYGNCINMRSNIDTDSFMNEDLYTNCSNNSVNKLDVDNSKEILCTLESGFRSKRLLKQKKKVFCKTSDLTIDIRKSENSKDINKFTVEPILNEMLKPKRKKRHMITEYDDEIIKKHIPMGCDLCTFVGEDFSEMSKHFSKQHLPLRPYVKCCGRKLTKRFLLIQHAYKHEDPEFFKCDECKKVFSDGYILRAHITNHHAPDKDLTFKCDQCPRSFSRRHLLELHKPAHIPINERKFFCERCPQAKPFASDHLLQIHIHMRHTKATNVCHVCAKEIRDNQAFKKHVRLHFEDSGPRVKCPKPDCDRWLKDMDNLKQHMRRHNDEGKIFACAECGKKCKNRRSLTSHLRYAHTGTVFTCDECHKTFKKAITLKEHMAQHTGETLYKCPFCIRTFNSNANMHSHKKKMHPIEWDIWRKTKSGSSQQIISKTSLVDTITKNENGNTFTDFIATANIAQ